MRATTSANRRWWPATSARRRVRLLGMIVACSLDREDFVALLGSVEDLVQHGTNEEVEVVEQEDRVALDVTLEHLDVQRT